MAFKMKNPSLAKLAKNVSKGSATMFNAKLKKASAEGKLSGKFKEAVDNSPMPKKGERGMLKSKDRKGNVEYHQGYTFKEAFADARKEGVKTFTHDGKKYNTKLASDKASKLVGKAAGKAASKTAGKNVGKALTKAAKKSKFKSSEEVYKFNADALKNTLSPDFKGSPKATENTKKIMKRYNLKEIPDQVDFAKLEAEYKKRKKNVKVKTLPEVEVAATKMKKPATKMKKKTIATKKEQPPRPKKGERGMLKSKDRKGNVEYHQGYTFKEAFADARKEGVKTFKHGGKKYNTKLAKSGKTEGISALDKLPRTESISALDKLAKIAGKAASKTAGKNVGKALTKAAKKSKTKKTSQEDFKPAFEGGDYSKADLAKMTPKQRKKIEEGQQ